MSAIPLGVDIGSSRIRVAAFEQTPSGARLRAVATRDIYDGGIAGGVIADCDYIGMVIEDAVQELDTRERRAVCAVGLPEALLFDAQFPAMRTGERRRAAHFQAASFIDYPLDDAMVRLAGKPGAYTIGVARKASLTTRLASLRCAGLRVIAIDHEAYALLRAYDDYDAVLDVGLRRSTLHIKTNRSPQSYSCMSGGAEVTSAIARDLNIDREQAEKRKRILGSAGAGERAKTTLVSDLTSLVRTAAKSHDIGRIALAGNSSRLPGLDTLLARAAGLPIDIPVSAALMTTTYPEDVLRSAAPDWTLAASLALWRFMR